ncbi:hypothetical protein FACS1894152_5720 [Bacilli bacterium]|nr:hypothetical protein FACS1894152_5720 [Bacilli bacterium]
MSEDEWKPFRLGILKAEFSGSLRDGVPCGKGEIKYENGDIEKGEWNEFGYPVGVPIYKYANGQ